MMSGDVKWEIDCRSIARNLTDKVLYNFASFTHSRTHSHTPMVVELPCKARGTFGLVSCSRTLVDRRSNLFDQWATYSTSRATAALKIRPEGLLPWLY